MSLLNRALPTLRRNGATAAAVRYIPLRAVSGIHTSAARSAFAEHDRDHPEQAEKIESHKQDSVSKVKAGKGEWKPELASASEQSVQGDKSQMTMEEMTKKGEEKGKSDKGK